MVRAQRRSSQSGSRGEQATILGRRRREVNRVQTGRERTVFLCVLRDPSAPPVLALTRKASGRASEPPALRAPGLPVSRSALASRHVSEATTSWCPPPPTVRRCALLAAHPPAVRGSALLAAPSDPRADAQGLRAGLGAARFAGTRLLRRSAAPHCSPLPPILALTRKASGRASEPPALRAPGSSGGPRLRTARRSPLRSRVRLQPQ